MFGLFSLAIRLRKSNGRPGGKGGRWQKERQATSDKPVYQKSAQPRNTYARKVSSGDRPNSKCDHKLCYRSKATETRCQSRLLEKGLVISELHSINKFLDSTTIHALTSKTHLKYTVRALTMLHSIQPACLLQETGGYVQSHSQPSSSQREAPRHLLHSEIDSEITHGDGIHKFSSLLHSILDCHPTFPGLCIRTVPPRPLPTKDGKEQQPCCKWAAEKNLTWPQRTSFLLCTQTAASVQSSLSRTNVANVINAILE